MRQDSSIRLSLAVVVTAMASTAFAEGYPVAGVAPQARPEGAPVIESVAHDAAWRAEALAGVSEPYPQSLGFLDDQGNWFTPFNRPNMPGRYDIRGLHGLAGAGNE